eukprot:7385051-Pyramimonas_sp.AAC.1
MDQRERHSQNKIERMQGPWENNGGWQSEASASGRGQTSQTGRPRCAATAVWACEQACNFP